MKIPGFTAEVGLGRTTHSSGGHRFAAQEIIHPNGDPYALAQASPRTGRALAENDAGKFTAQGAHEGAAVAGLLLQHVNFPTFVAGLIDGVFDSIVTSSIKQMEAYGQLANENVAIPQGGLPPTGGSGCYEVTECSWFQAQCVTYCPGPGGPTPVAVRDCGWCFSSDFLNALQRPYFWYPK